MLRSSTDENAVDPRLSPDPGPHGLVIGRAVSEPSPRLLGDEPRGHVVGRTQTN
jgi:hypothetical protein